LLLLAAGCASPVATGSPAAPASASAAPPSASAVLPSASADATLAAALQPLRAASAFETVIEVGGKTLVSATGRSVGDASKLTVTTTGRSVDYVEIPPNAWAREASGPGVLVAADRAPVAPLEVLGKPLTLDAGVVTGGQTSFKATYPAKALGLEGDPVTVTITVNGDTMTFRYEATTAGRQTTSTTTIRPAPADPITAPTP